MVGVVRCYHGTLHRARHVDCRKQNGARNCTPTNIKRRYETENMRPVGEMKMEGKHPEEDPGWGGG